MKNQTKQSTSGICIEYLEHLLVKTDEVEQYTAVECNIKG